MNSRKNVDFFALLIRYRSVVMGICALAILFFHDWIATVGEFPVIGTIERVLKKYGYYGVDVFFLLSGMGLTYSMRKEPNVKRFYLKRIKRVYLPYIEVILLKTLLEKWSGPMFIRRALCVEIFSRGIYTLLWFVPMILLVYLLYPLLHGCLERSKNEDVFLACVIGCVVLLEMLLIPYIHSDYRGLLFRLPTFLVGVGIGRRSQRKHITCTMTQAIIGAGILVGIYVLSGYCCKMLGIAVMEAVQLCAFAILFSFMVSGICDWINLCRGILFLIPKWGIALLSFCGMFTLEIYCVQEFYWYIAGPLEGKLSSLQINFISMVVLVIAGYLVNRTNTIICNGITKMSTRAA